METLTAPLELSIPGAWLSLSSLQVIRILTSNIPVASCTIFKRFIVIISLEPETKSKRGGGTLSLLLHL